MKHQDPLRSRREREEQSSRDEIEELFEQCDADSDGLISFPEFQSMLLDLEADMTSDTMRIGFAEVDTNRDGRISYSEFSLWWRNH